MAYMVVNGAKEGNLKDISLEIPKNKFVVFTGLSGSGKSTLAVDVIYQECQRQYLEAMGYQGIRKPDVVSVSHASPAILITQNGYNRNPRSSVGTVTDIYTDLRMVFEKLGKRTCPNCHRDIFASECREEVEKKEDDFEVYMYCSNCNYRMEKFTRTHFSYNTREGACKTCQGLGRVMQVDEGRVIHQDLSLEDGAVDFWEHRYKDYQISVLYSAFRYYGIPTAQGVLVKDFSEAQRNILFYGVEAEEVRKTFADVIPPKTVAEGRFEGVMMTLWKRISDRDVTSTRWEEYFKYTTCPDCGGERLNQLSRNVTVSGVRLPPLTFMSLKELNDWISHLEGSLTGTSERQMTQAYLLDLRTKVQRIINVGLGYLSLDRQTMTLSGGESQRLRLAAALGSDISGIIYIMDEPTIGLHPRDTEGIVNVLKGLRDLDNTVMVIEHDVDVIKSADHIVDIGPGSGKHGGTVVGEGNFEDLKRQESSVTGTYLNRKGKAQLTRKVRKSAGREIKIENANLYNLKGIDVNIPVGCLTSVTGVSGSGKSTLVFEVLAKYKVGELGEHNKVYGTDMFDDIVAVEQSPLTRMARSNVATYSGVYSEMRKVFAATEEARDKGLSASNFSFNTSGGRCENCQGMGYVVSNMLFFEDTEVLCPVCGGNRFNEEVLSVKYAGFNVKQVLNMSVEDALMLFKEHGNITRTLGLLTDVGLGYLELGQPLTTLSGGEGQRLKLAKKLLDNGKKNLLYLIDEPTTGLHPIDVEHFITLLDRMVDAGNTVVVVEHNQQVIKASDWVIDLGPGGGEDGGNVVACGTPEQIMRDENSVTGKYLCD